ncbi:tetratricopeptide repeat protein [Niabella ginsengisoli]|uniref:Tetratricopeptide repeat protein n=1 Tax=Niabella ginsengisoli TaxID=522298 RepID=A0ABS9SFF0_9BACT|nr:tetratricopeptide repeat protein [Niabella ginsengisoli]MCH5597092.1 tetratricopeptide repeat protein [Niabella ginsengisoli]
MNNVDNPINLVYYLGREQYGSAPLIYGPHFAAEYKDDDGDGMIDMKTGEMKYVKGKDRYIATGRDREPLYQSSDMQLFPRVWDRSNDQNHAQFYADWLSLEQNRDPNTGQVVSYGAPSYADNINWFFSYQTDFLFMRYFMWNYAGRQNDLQGRGNKRDGNWISGIGLIDTPRLGDQSKMPESLKENKAHNTLFMLPIILGILGLVFQLFRNKNDFIVTFILFFFMGEALVLYLNAPGPMPRERDYVFVGAMYVFAIWIGLSVLAFVRLALEKTDKDLFKKVLIYGATFTFLVTIISSLTGSGSGAIMASLAAAVLFVVVVAAVTYIIKAVSSNGTNFKMAGITASVLCLLVPVLMAQQEWNDHDRSQKTVAPDLAKDYLESCAPNAILFTFGDNDTYPLWYAQEVEGIRKDIRIINTSLLGIDWYINQLRYKINDAPGVDVIWTPEQIEGANRQYIRIGQTQQMQNLDANAFYPLYDIMKDYLGQKVTDEDGNDVGPNTMPFSKFFVPVDKQLVIKNGTVTPTDSVLSQLAFEIPASAVTRDQLMMLNIIATNKWQRPIYFTAPYGQLGFGQHLRKDGLTYRLVPVVTKNPEQNWVTDQAMKAMRMGGSSIKANNLNAMSENLKKFEFGGANKKGVYFDETNRQSLLNIRAIFAEAAGNLADAGKTEEAIKLLNKEAAGIDPENLPYGMTSYFSQHNQTGIMLAEAYYKAGQLDKARKVAEGVRKDINSQKNYYSSLKTEKPNYYASMENESIINEIMGEVLNAVEQQYDPLKKAAKNPAQEITPEALLKAADSVGITVADSTK